MLRHHSNERLRVCRYPTCVIRHGLHPDAARTALASSNSEVDDLVGRCRRAVAEVSDRDHSAAASDGEEWVTDEEQLREMVTDVESALRNRDIVTPAQWIAVMLRDGWSDARAIKILGTLLGHPEIQIVKKIFCPQQDRRKTGGLVDWRTGGAVTSKTAIEYVASERHFISVHRVRCASSLPVVGSSF